MKKAVLFITLLFTALLLLGCQEEKTPESICLLHSEFSPEYAIDEELQLENVNLLLVYDNGNTTKTIPCTAEMIRGFDTSTTGTKTLRAAYKGLESNAISYTVYNPEDISREIKTTTRIDILKTVSSGSTTFDFRLLPEDVTVRAISFHLETTMDLSSELTDLVGTIDGAMDDFYWRKTSTKGINILISGSERGQSSGAFFHLMILSEEVDIRLTEITVSDGVNDYYLPRVG